MADTNSTYSINGGLYSGSPIWNAVNSMSGGGYQPQSLIDYMTQNGYLNQVAAPQQGQQSTMPTYTRPTFTPNAYTQAQLAGMGKGVTPQWMMDAYTQKIGRMGGNANLPPFGVTQSGFPGIGGKTAPAQGSVVPTSRPTPTA